MIEKAYQSALSLISPAYRRKRMAQDLKNRQHDLPLVGREVFCPRMISTGNMLKTTIPASVFHWDLDSRDWSKGHRVFQVSLAKFLSGAKHKGAMSEILWLMIMPIMALAGNVMIME